MTDNIKHFLEKLHTARAAETPHQTCKGCELPIVEAEDFLACWNFSDFQPYFYHIGCRPRDVFNMWRTWAQWQAWRTSPEFRFASLEERAAAVTRPAS